MSRDYLILPGCDDTNRGDQALIWETVRIAKDAGYDGNYYMIATEECSRQSEKIGIKHLEYILPHPSHHLNFRKDNRKYNIGLKIRWIFFSIIDIALAVPLLFRPTRPIFSLIIGKKRKKTLDMYKQTSAAFVKGGGFLHAYGGLVDTYKIFFFLYHINLANSMNIPVYVMPNSYGPFKSPFVSKMIGYTLKKCKVVYSRESISQKSLRDYCGVESFLSNDLAMYLQKDNDFDITKAIKQIGDTANKEKVAITVRPYRFPGKNNSEKLYMNYKKSIAGTMIWLSKNGYYPVLVEHTFSESFHEQDMICIKEIMEILPNTVKYGVFADLSLTCRQMKSVYSQFDYIIGTRFHSMIFSLMENVPGIAITYGGNKGDGIMKDMGLNEYVIPIEKMKKEDLISKFEKLVNNKGEILENIEKQIDKIKIDRNEVLKIIQNSGD